MRYWDGQSPRGPWPTLDARHAEGERAQPPPPPARHFPPTGPKNERARQCCVDSAQHVSDDEMANKDQSTSLEDRLAKLRSGSSGMASSMGELESIKYNRKMMSCVKERLAASRNRDKPRGAVEVPKDTTSSEFERRRKQLLETPTRPTRDTKVSRLCRAREEVATICRMIKKITRAWDVELTIDTLIPGRYSAEDEQYLQKLLSYILRGEHCNLGDDLLLEDWDEIRHHLLKGLQVISDGEEAKDRMSAPGEGSTYKATMVQNKIVVKKVYKGYG
ncbi:unnamed protein product [Ostreobium quekettii]|uniref:Uncharacterized protein n=1 Tax=Ostreobium quekettii TaxID=121088 RepID=A0A8S1J6T3_9CHLO|nr:unnamed protein product [Ostreobium quekettii]|eukprot:evm.model.scf_21EXC.8 EVM.evm.TU.scf_21EXC.8   scf_21EXC:86512-91632(-)